MLNLGDIVYVSGDKAAVEMSRFMVGKIIRIPTKLCADYDVEIGDRILTFSEEYLIKTNQISYLLYGGNSHKK